jgi:AraC-like DNA-binding protein
MNDLVVQLPASLDRGEQIMVSGVFGHLLARLVRVAGIDGRADVTSAFLDLAEAGQTIKSWRRQWLRTTERCAALLPDADRYGGHVTDTRVTQMLRFIEERYVDPKLTMKQVAQVIELCPSHAARMLKQQTGGGFLVHLHRCRILLARRLLVETTLPMKEVSATVGYSHPSQFSRHFKLACGETPRAFGMTLNRTGILGEQLV